MWPSVSSNIDGLSDISIKRCIAASVSVTLHRMLMLQVCIFYKSMENRNPNRPDILKNKVSSIEKDNNSKIRIDGCCYRCKMLAVCETTVESHSCWIISVYRFAVCFEVDKFRKGSISLCKNRVQEIKKDGEIVFGYVSTKENPADVATRGADVQKRADNQGWWYGPKWLTGPRSEWPGLPEGSQENEDLEYESEIKKTKPEK